MKNNSKATKPATITEYEVADLVNLGWIQITEMGEENLYFTLADGSRCFVKLEA